MVAIVIDDGLPVIYRRRVLGRNGEAFDAFKLRTMRVDAEAWLNRDPILRQQYQTNLKHKTDPRVTRVGRVLRRYSIDEIPQLVNVFVGQMAIVGPRMIHPDELARFGALGPQLLTVRPGLTGLWQVSGRQDLRFEERLVLDAEYMARRSLLLDLAILARTIPAVLTARGAY